MSDDELDRRQPFADIGPDMIAEVAIAALGMSLGPPGALLAGLVPLTARGLHLAHHELEARKQRSAAVWVVAGEHADVDPIELMDRAEADADRRHLGFTAGEAAATSRYPARIIVLGRALAAGVLADDDARVDQQQAMIEALAVVERPHLTLLASLQDAVRWRPKTADRLVTESEIDLMHRRRFGDALHRYMATLNREGLLARVDLLNDDGQPYFGWELSHFGSQVLWDLQAAVEKIDQQ